MTITLFITMLTLGAGITSLLTEAIKNAYANANRPYSSNIIALVDAIFVGCGGTAITYMLLDIPWSINNVICMLLMGAAVWIASMIGYDKVLQLISQLAALPDAPNELKGDDEK